MVNWKGVSGVLFVLCGTIFLFYLLVGFILAPTHSPEGHPIDFASKKEEAVIMFTVVGSLFIGGVLSLIGGIQQDAKQRRKKNKKKRKLK
ncbi:hypothetical protein K8R43_05760 [archaeon]|nr:hypothetical protein [archaeon]